MDFHKLQVHLFSHIGRQYKSPDQLLITGLMVNTKTHLGIVTFPFFQNENKNFKISKM